MKPIDYTALIQPLSFRNIQMRVSARKFWLSVVYLILATVAFVLFAVLRLNGFMANIMDIGLIVSIVILAKVLADLITLITHANREIQAEQFAELNGFMLLRNVKKPPYRGRLFNKGIDRLIETAYRLETTNGPVEIGRYTYFVPSGRNGTTYGFRYLRMNIPRKVPHIIVDNKHNNLLGLFSTLSGELHREQALHLEGDFDDHFTLYAPKEYERDALYLFTPNVMQAILDTMPNADLELVDDSLIVYETKQKSVTRKDTIESLLAVATILAPKLGHQVDYYTDERVDSRSKNTVSSKGRRLNASRDAGLVFTLVAFSMLIISRFADDPRKGLFMASFMLGIPLLIFVVAVIISKRKD